MALFSASHGWKLPVLALTAALLGASAAGASTLPRLFGFPEVANADIRKFRNWTNVLSRSGKDLAKNPSCTFGRGCPAERWARKLDELRTAPPDSWIAEVNAFFNAIPYITDPNNWSRDDYWATPFEFMSRGGDCEDYAVAKYLMLSALGYPKDRMRVVILNDHNLGIPHAVLAVYTDTDVVILDNQSPHPLSSSRIRHYTPIYSINENGWWYHGRR